METVTEEGRRPTYKQRVPDSPECVHCGRTLAFHQFGVHEKEYYCMSKGAEDSFVEFVDGYDRKKAARHAEEINSPKHYRVFPDMEAYDIIVATLTPEELQGYLKGNVLKYRLRAGEKGPPEKCIGKANWYRDRLNEL